MAKLLSLLAFAAVLSGAGAAQAQPVDLSRFSAALARDPAERLVLCDTTFFLSSRPRLDADRIHVQRFGRPYEMLLPPYFLVGGRLYDDDSERAYYRLRRQTGLTLRQVGDVQDGVGRGLIDAYRRGGPLPNGFVREQGRFCRAWLRRPG